MTKHLEYILYGFTLVYCFVIAGTGVGDTGHVDSYLGQRALFYIVEAGLLIIAMIRCRKLYYNYDDDYFRKTEKIFAAADCCFVMIGIVTVFSVAGMIPIFVFLPKRVFDFGAANGLFVLLLITGLVFLLYTIVIKRFDIVKIQREKMRHPLSEKTEDFYAFIHSSDGTEKEPPNNEMSDALSLLDVIVPTEEEFQQHLQQISLINHISEPKQFWECPFCGSLNPTDSGQCDFCGADRKQ